MKAPKCKIKKQLPIEELPAYLRSLADALENKTDHLPKALIDWPASVAKIEIKGRGRDDAWELKLKIKGEPLAELELEEPAGEAAINDEAGATSKDKYKLLKNKMKSAFKKMGEALEVNKLPASETVNAFLANSDRMLTFTGQKYGEPHYCAYRSACRELADAYAARNGAWLKKAYAALNQLMHECHKEYK